MTTPTPYNDMVRAQQARTDMRFQGFLARSFGEKIVATDEHLGEAVTVTGFSWRGVFFITSIKPKYPG